MYGSRHQIDSGLTRYGSAPSSLLAGLVDELSPTVPETLIGKYFSGDSSCLTSESSCQVNVSPKSDLGEIDAGSANQFSGRDLDKSRCVGGEGFQKNSFSVSDTVFRSQAPDAQLVNPSYVLNQMTAENFSTASGLRSSSANSLLRHSSSPAGFFKNLDIENGILVGGVGSFSCETSSNGGRQSAKKLKSHLRPESLPRLPELCVPDVGESISGGIDGGGGGGGGGSGGSPDGCSFGDRNMSQSYIYGGFQMGSWEESNPIVFSGAGTKRGGDINGEMVRGLSHADSQFSLPTTSLEMAAVEKAFHIQQEYVPCKLRARRGYATHPRSIAERERRIKISEKLRKLQELVPNMDKQTNTADMLDLAVQHIKVLQNQVQKLNRDRANCTCSSKQAF